VGKHDEELLGRIRKILETADHDRLAGRWALALGNYRMAEVHLPRMALVHHNIALCHLALSNLEEALRESEIAIGLDPAFWRSHLVRIKALRRLGRADDAVAAMRELPESDEPLIAQERLSLQLHELGDAAAAHATATRALASKARLPAETAAEIELGALVALLYDRGGQTAKSLSEAFFAYSRKHLYAGRPAEAPPRASPARARKRVGIISPQLFASPVYFFGIGALRLLAMSADLVFFHRGTRQDWATAGFRALSADWRNVAGLEPIALESELRRHALDALIDMGGWMDRIALQALAGKPARRMYKWVGGQSVSTGLASFDGFIGDLHQSPPELQPLYTEPLASMPRGYATYTPPDYMPAAQAADAGFVVGVISNPVKVSAGFLEAVAERMEVWRELGLQPQLRFIDKRYRHAELQARISAALRTGEEPPARFVVPDKHRDYLSEVGRLSLVVDTFPYSGGLTTMEALTLGVPCLTRAGKLFSERHTWAHCRYAGMESAAFDFDADVWTTGWTARTRIPAPGVARASLVPAGSPRTDHASLARSLLELVES